MKNSKEYILELAKQNKPLMAYAASQPLEQWQKAAREKLTELLGLPLTMCEDMFTIVTETQSESYKKIDFTFQSEPGYEVSCSFLTPKVITKPQPVVICLQGHSTGMHISVGEPIFERDVKSIEGGRDFAVQAVKQGYCAVAMEQRYMGTAGSMENGAPSCLEDNTAMGALLLGRTAVGERVWDVQRLIDVLEKHFSEYIDMEKIICLGNSGGGSTTFYASCVDERIWMSVPSCSVCDFEASIMAMYHCPCNFIPGIRKYFNMGDLGCLIASRNLIVIGGTQDSIFPIEGVENSYKTIEACYKAIGKGERCHLIKGNGGHQFYPKEAWPVVNVVVKNENL